MIIIGVVDNQWSHHFCIIRCEIRCEIRGVICRTLTRWMRESFSLIVVVRYSLNTNPTDAYRPPILLAH